MACRHSLGLYQRWIEMYARLLIMVVVFAEGFQIMSILAGNQLGLENDKHLKIV